MIVFNTPNLPNSLKRFKIPMLKIIMTKGNQTKRNRKLILQKQANIFFEYTKKVFNKLLPNSFIYF